jgi:PucR family transcriptional regulator, purine catabolism regulatory protein
VLGYLAVGRAPALSAVERQVVNAAVPLCVLSLDRSRLVGESTRRLRASVLRLLLAGHTDLVSQIADQLWNGLPGEPVLVVECRANRSGLAPGSVSVAVRDRLAATRERLVTDRMLAAAELLDGELDEAYLVLIAESATDDVARLLGRLREVEGLRIGVSEPAPYAELDRAREQAARAAEYGTGLDTRVTWFRQIPRLGLRDLLPADTAAEFASGWLRPLVDRLGQRRPAQSAELLRSLRVWLAHHGQWDPAAAELGVHRHTLRNRIRKVERLLDRELDSPDLRAELWLALRLVEREPGAARERGA